MWRKFSFKKKHKKYVYIGNGPKREIEAIQQISSGVHKGVKLIPLCTIAGLFYVIYWNDFHAVED